MASLLKAHDKDKVKAEDEKSALKKWADGNACQSHKQISNAQAGVSSLGPKRVKSVAFKTQAASA